MAGRKRRAYGSGGYTIEPRTGHAVAKFRQADGVVVRRTFPTANAAEVWLQEQVYLRNQGVATPKGATKVTVEEWAAEWLIELRSSAARGRGTTRRWGTMAGYEDKLNWLVRAYGRHRLSEITAEHIEALYGWLRIGVVPRNSFGAPVGAKLSSKGTPLKVQGVIHFHHVLGPMFRRAKRRGLIVNTPMEDVAVPGIPPEESFEGVALDLRAWREMLAVAGRHPNGASALTAMFLGSRRGETLGLTWSDVVLDHELGPHLTITRTIQRVTGRGLVSENPKTERSQRTVAIPQQLAQALQKHRDSGQSGPVFVFTSPRNSGTAMDTGYWHRRVWTPIKKEMRIEMRPHDLRHTLKSLLTRYADPAKVRSEVIEQYFGWSKGGVPSDYTHLRVRDTRPVADELERLSSGGSA